MGFWDGLFKSVKRRDSRRDQRYVGSAELRSALSDAQQAISSVDVGDSVALVKGAQETIELGQEVLTHAIEALTRDVEAMEILSPTLTGLRVNLQSIGVGPGLQEALASARELEDAHDSVELALREVWANFYGSEVVNLVNTARRVNLDVRNAVEDARKYLIDQEIEVTLTGKVPHQLFWALARLMIARSALEKLADLKLADLIHEWYRKTGIERTIP